MRYHLNVKFNVEFEIVNIKYRSNFFAIVEAKIIKYDSPDILPKKMTIKGEFPSVFKGNIFNAEVCISEHLQYGFFLKLLSTPIEKISNSKKGMTNFIKTHTNKITKSEAEEVVTLLGVDLIDKIKENPDLLDNIKISNKKKTEIKKAVINHWHFEKLLLFLQMNNIDSSIANLIYDKFEDDCFNILYKKPYKFINIKGLNFSLIDKLVYENNIPYSKKDRLQAIIISILNMFVENLGFTCCLKENLSKNINSFTKIYAKIEDNYFTQELIDEVLEKMIKNNQIIIENYNNKDYIYLINQYINENNLSTRIVELNSKDYVINTISDSKIDKFIKEYELNNNITLAKGQRDAVKMVLQNKLSILTGGPGTGKTQTVNIILKCIQELMPNLKVSLMAPTGKASNRMSEVTNKEATTIHRAIGLNAFIKDNETKEITSDFIIIDECSMIDSYLFEQLLMNVKDDARILFVGDANQLPSVGAGNVFKNMIDSGIIQTTELTEIFRQALSSNIITNSHKIINGKLCDELSLKASGSDFYFREENSSDKILDIVEKLYENILNRKKCSVEDICILAPIKDSVIGTHNLNRIIQNKINPCKNKEYKLNDIDVLRVNDRVMQTVNNYELGVMNGEVGIIVDIAEYNNTGLKAIYVEYKNKEELVCYTTGSIKELTLAYACSVHKMQGSEVPYIIHIVHGSQKQMLERKLIYTAWTRAKKELFVIGQKEALNKAINNVSSFNRQSLLKEKIIEKSI